MEQILAILSTLGGTAGAVITIVTFITLLSKKPKAWIKKIIKSQNEESNQELKVLLNEINKKIEQNKDASLAALRHEITDMYDTYYPAGYLPVNIRKDLISLYSAYEKCGGNSYVSELYKELIELKTKENA